MLKRLSTGTNNVVELKKTPKMNHSKCYDTKHSVVYGNTFFVRTITGTSSATSLPEIFKNL